jgi:hypothetical protein
VLVDGLGVCDDVTVLCALVIYAVVGHPKIV